MKRLHLAFTAIIAIAVVGCGGGGASTPPAGGSTSTGGAAPVAPAASPSSASGSGSGSQSKATGTATFTIRIPVKSTSASTNRKKPAYVSSGTNSVAFTVGNETTVVPLTLGSSTCPLAMNYYSCTAQSNVPAGTNETISIATYASSDGSGTPLSLNSMVETITAGQNNPLTITLNGVVNTLALQYSATSVVYNMPGGFTVTLLAYDAAGDLIAGPGSLVDSAGNTVTVTLTPSGTDAADFSVGEENAGTTAISWAVLYGVGSMGNAGTSATFTATAMTTTPTTYTFTSGSPQTISVLASAP